MNVKRLFVALFLLALFTIAVRETLDPDMWWHLRTGEYILQAGIPRHDVFSFTVPDHEWLTHEWLSQVFMWSVYRVGGLPGLMVVFALLTAVSFFLVYRVSAGRPYLAAFVVLLGAFASAIVWGVRPQIFNTLFYGRFYLHCRALSERGGWGADVMVAPGCDHGLGQFPQRLFVGRGLSGRVYAGGSAGDCFAAACAA
ncbi:MAG: hypothetical protein IPH82_16920 [Chloroflexi bacterium]|nr:hypothetical protein [Chloroflexota bacterium]